jgi:protocatechuate 3,4-dioxygenase beta subunit
MQVSRRTLLRRLAALPMPILLAAACAPTSTTPSSQLPPTSGSPPTTAPAPTLAPPPTTAPAPTAAPPPTTAPLATSAPPPTTVAPAVARALPPTPACDDDDEPTIAQTEGPYFTRNSPERTSLVEPGTGGTKIILSGYVFATDCRPVARALLDFWQADDAGQYDNSGFRYRGHQFADDQGHFTLETVVPGLYPGRTRHFHVKVQAPNRPVLTTQLYFAGEPRNRSDGIYRPELEMDIQDAAAGKLAAFNFVVNA